MLDGSGDDDEGGDGDDGDMRNKGKKRKYPSFLFHKEIIRLNIKTYKKGRLGGSVG